jgi:putative redox protein
MRVNNPSRPRPRPLLCFFACLEMNVGALWLPSKALYRRAGLIPRFVNNPKANVLASRLRLPSTISRTRSHSFSTLDDGEGQKHVKTYQITGKTTDMNKASLTMRTNTGHCIYTDLPKPMGGKDTAPQPVETLLAALIGCTQATALFVGRQIKPERLLIERMEFHLTAQRDERGALQLPIEEDPPVPSRLQRVSGTVHVFAAKGKKISDRQIMILREQTEKRCPVANMMIASGCEMQVEGIDGGSLQDTANEV